MDGIEQLHLCRGEWRSGRGRGSKRLVDMLYGRALCGHRDTVSLIPLYEDLGGREASLRRDSSHLGILQELGAPAGKRRVRLERWGLWEG